MKAPLYLSVAGGEGPQVGHDGGGDQDVSGEVVVELAQVERRLAPACLLPSQPPDELLRPLQLLTAEVHLQGAAERGGNTQQCMSSARSLATCSVPTLHILFTYSGLSAHTNAPHLCT